MKKSNIVILGVIAVVVFGIIFGIVSFTENWGKSRDQVDTEAAMKNLDRLYSQLNISKPTPKKDADYQDTDENAEKIAVLPDIGEYPFVVNPTTDNFLTIYSSLEKIDWLIEAANKFNQSAPTADNHPISVGIRAIPGNLGADFISSDKYRPDVYAPSSEIYGDMLIGQGVKAALVEKSLAGNLTGVVMTQKMNDDLTNKYGALNSETIIEAVLNNGLTLGYTTPLSNEDGFNFILTLLADSDSNNPLSDNAIERLRKFQDKIPFISYDIDQLKASLTGGALDAIILNHQAYTNSPNLAGHYTFVPIGIRQDNPVYEIGDLSALKKQITAQFIAFCKNPDSQKSAAEKGFNNLQDYVGAAPMNGTTILQAQEIYKKEKNGSSDLTAVFVADISGSMEGSPLLNLKASLNRAAGIIDSNTNIGLVTFSDTVTIDVPIAKFDNTQRSYFSNAVKSMRASGSTAMFDAIVVAQKNAYGRKKPQS
ncbi:MAG: substrate-binding domain-containing protein [Peptococcaceae bacterium]|nr:substrate-binding domain-containing protein [Peptococcaceae bacterium]